MLRTSRNNNNIISYEELNGKFNWNRTPIAPLGTRGMLFIHPGRRNTFTPYCDDEFTVGRARHHYRLLEFYVPTTREYRISGTFHLNPTHWKIPTISEQDKIVVAATELLEQHKKFTPPLGQSKKETYSNHQTITRNPIQKSTTRDRESTRTKGGRYAATEIDTATPQKVDRRG